MEESTSSENVWCKTKADEQNNLYHPESITQSMEANSTSLADIFDTAFSSTVDPSPQPRFNSANDMEYDHLFAESDVEDLDVVPINPYVNPSHHSTSNNNFVFGTYLHGPETTGILHERDPPVKHKCKRSEEQSLDYQPSDNLDVAGPSRLSDGTSNKVMQNMENDSANEVNTLYHSVLPNTINSQQHSTHSTRNDDTPSAPDLQLDWSSSSDDATSSDDEDGSVEVLVSVNHNNNKNSVQNNEESNRPVTVVDLTVESDEEHAPPTPTTSVVSPGTTDYVHSGNNTYCMHSPPDYVYHGRCMHHNYRIPIPVIPVRYSQLPDASTGMLRPRMHPVQERLWRMQQRVQEVHRRSLHPRFSTHHSSTTSCNPHVHQANQHTCNSGNPNPANNRCNGSENMTFAENYFPPPILPPPQQPTVYSHPEARRPPNVSPSCPAQSVMENSLNSVEMEPTPPVMLPSMPVHPYVPHMYHHYGPHRRPPGPQHRHHIHINWLQHLHLQGSDAHDTMPFSSFGLLHPARPMSAQLENYMRLVNLRHMAHINCGATQESIESHTFRYKYKREKKVENEDSIEKCTICLSEFEDCESVRLSLAIPLDREGYSRCSMYDVNYTLILLNESYVPNPLWPTKTCQHGWEFNYSDVPYATVATELEWVCQYDSLPTVAQSIFFIGAIFGGLIFGWIADQYGRIPALIGANMMGFLAGVATAFTNTFWQFALCRFFVGFAFDNCFTMMYILVLEYVGPKWRTFVANMSIAMFFTFASCILPWIAYFLLDWRMTCIATSVPLVLAIATPWLIPESARWLVSQGQVDKAINILGKFERINGTKVPDDVYKRFRETCARICKEEEADKTYSVLDLFKTPRLRNITILFIIIWMAISLVFDGHVRNVNNLGLNVFVTFTIAAATELPADTFLTLVLDRWGRRWLACCSLVISGVFSIWASIVSNHIYTATLAILGRFWINISYNIGLQYAAEVLPTVVRAQGVALIHIMGYVASILAPFVVYLDVVSSILPLLVLGTLGIICGLLTLFLPETLDKDLPQTLQDGEDFGKDQKMWDFPCIERKHKDEEISPVAMFRSFSRCSTRNSMRASLRGETLRSNMIRRSSIKSKKFKSSVIEVEKL